MTALGRASRAVDAQRCRRPRDAGGVPAKAGPTDGSSGDSAAILAQGPGDTPAREQAGRAGSTGAPGDWRTLGECERVVGERRSGRREGNGALIAPASDPAATRLKEV